MLNLKEAIALAQEAHEGQWRHPTIINYAELIRLIGASYACDLQGGCFKDNVYKHNNKLITKIDDNNYYYSSPYITHPLAVMEMMATTEEKIVAVLHDVFEESITYQLFQEGSRYFIKTNSNNVLTSSSVYYALQCLTKRKNEPYDNYIKDIAENKLATKIKIADMVHNLSESPSEYAKEKYIQVLPILLKVL